MNISKSFALLVVLCMPMQSCSADRAHEQSKVFHAKVDGRYATEVAVQDPSGRFIYVRSMELICQGTSYSDGELTIKPGESIGVVWSDGVPLAVDAFREAGNYRIYASDNLETELENSFATTYKIHYQPVNSNRNDGDKGGCVLNGSPVGRSNP